MPPGRALASACLVGLVATAGVPAARSVTGGQLALMPLSQAELGKAAVSLPLSPGSGVLSNARVAGDALGRITAAKLSRQGRITGYVLDYDDRSERAIRAGAGLSDVETRVDLYRDDAAARVGLGVKRADERLLRKLDSATLSVELAFFAPGPVGDASLGMTEALHPRGGPALYEAQIFFLTGPLVGTVSVSGARPDGLQALARQLTGTLGSRIKLVLAGRITGRPVPLPRKRGGAPPASGPDLAAVAVSTADAGGGAVTQEGFTDASNGEAVAIYSRTIHGAGAISFTTGQLYLYASPTTALFSASIFRALFASPLVTNHLPDTVGGVHVLSAHVTKVPLGLPDGAYAAEIMFTLERNLTTVLTYVSVSKGRFVELLSFATSSPPSASAVRRVVRAAQARL
jgi:hypothetical protein